MTETIRGTEHEKALLGSLMLAPELWADCHDLAPEDFSLPAHRTVFAAIQALQLEDAVDYVSVHDYLERHNELAQVGGSGFIASLIQGIPTLRSIRHYAELVKAEKLRARLEQTSRVILASALSSADPSDALRRAEEAIFALGGTSTSGWYTPQALVDSEEAQYQVRRERRSGVTLGMGRMDEKVSLSPGSFWVLGARPSIGKSAFLANVAHNCVENNVRFLWVVAEMGQNRNFWRIISVASGVSLFGIKNARLGGSELGRYGETMLSVRQKNNFRLRDCPGITVAQIMSDVRRAKSELGGLDLVLVDYFQLLGSAGRRQTDREEYAANVKGLVELASREKVPVLCGAQLNRNAQTDEEKDKPTTAELKGTGNLEEAASGVILLHRWNRNAPMPEQRGAEIIVAKHQDGPCGSYKSYFDHESQRWTVE